MIRRYLSQEEMFVVVDEIAIGIGTHAVLEHFFVDAMMRVRVKVIIFRGVGIALCFLLRFGRFAGVFCNLGRFVFGDFFLVVVIGSAIIICCG